MFPEVASTMAPRVDALYLFLVGLTAFFAAACAGVSRGSKLTSTRSKSLPASIDIVLTDVVMALSTWVQSIGHS